MSDSQSARSSTDRGEPTARADALHGSLRVTEVFHSIQGEALDVGWPTVFIRLTGCPLRCRYCDTEYAFTGGQRRTISELLEQTAAYGAGYVCVTGGEPLAQPGCIDLLRQLCDAGYRVSLETSGAIDIASVDDRVSRIVDIKTPDSGEVDRNLLPNLRLLQSNDALKFVICSAADYQWTKTFLEQHGTAKSGERGGSGFVCPIFLSPSFGVVSPGELADWILADALPVRLQLQLHKVLWGDVPGR